MKHWPDAQLRQMQELTDEGDIMQAAFQLTGELGFDYLAFSTTHSSPQAFAPQLEGVDNLPPQWSQRYRQRGYVMLDPTIRHCRHSVVPLLWTDDLFARTQAFRQDAWDHGIRHGLSVAIHDTASQASILSLIRGELAVSADEFCIKAGQCLWLGNLLHQQLGDHLFSTLDGTRGSLSMRELEVLRWSAQGKTAGDIATILNLSERTVNFHINSAVKKMGMANKTAAVVHAAQSGLL